MPKSKKRKNADFQKVKFKLGKKPRTSDSEVNLSFKTRTIKIYQSVSTNGEESQTKGQQNFEDLLKWCDPNKTRTQRLAAINGLRELVHGPGVDRVVFFFTMAMEKVANLLSDPETPVRKALIRFCRSAFSIVSAQKTGFFYPFSLRLRCAMRHVSSDVCQDAFTIFDMLVNRYPREVISEYCPLIPCFIEWISFYLKTCESGSGNYEYSTFTRMSTQLGQIGMLQRLCRIVDIYIQRQKDTDISKEGGPSVPVGHNLPVVNIPCVPPYIFRTWGTWPKEPPIGAKEQDYAFLTQSGACLKKFFSAIFPFIQHCWNETLLSNTDFVLTKKSLPLVTAVISLLCKLVQCWRTVYDPSCQPFGTDTWFHVQFLKDLQQLILPHFPLVLTGTTGNMGMKMKRKDDKKQAPTAETGSNSLDGQSALDLETSVLKLNLQVCEIMASFPGNHQRGILFEGAKGEWQQDIVMFLLENRRLFTAPETSTLVAPVLLQVFNNYPVTSNQEELLACVINQFVEAHPLSREKAMYMDILNQLAFGWERDSPYHMAFVSQGGSHHLLQPYFEHLPMLLLALKGENSNEDMAGKVAEALCHHYSQPLTQVKLQYMESFLDPEEGPLTSLPQSCHQTLVRAIKWTYHYSPAPPVVLDLVARVIRHPNVDKKMGAELVNGLWDEFDHVKKCLDLPEDEINSSKKSYARFYWGIIVGHKSEELKAFHEANTWETGGLTRILWQSSLEQMEKHHVLLQMTRDFFDDTQKDRVELDKNRYIFSLKAMARNWAQEILGKHCALSTITTYGALLHWRNTIGCLGSHGALHLDNAPAHPSFVGQPAVNWLKHVHRSLPVFKENMRTFSRLAFSVMYSVISFEWCEREVTLPEDGVVRMMVDAVLNLMKMSLMMILDIMQFMAEFVQGEQSEKESMKAAMVMVKLMTAEEIAHLRVFYRVEIGRALTQFVDTVRSATPQVDGQSWFLDLVNLIPRRPAC